MGPTTNTMGELGWTERRSKVEKRRTDRINEKRPPQVKHSHDHKQHPSEWKRRSLGQFENPTEVPSREPVECPPGLNQLAETLTSHGINVLFFRTCLKHHSFSEVLDYQRNLMALTYREGKSNAKRVIVNLPVDPEADLVACQLKATFDEATFVLYCFSMIFPEPNKNDKTVLLVKIMRERSTLSFETSQTQPTKGDIKCSKSSIIVESNSHGVKHLDRLVGMP